MSASVLRLPVKPPPELMLVDLRMGTASTAAGIAGALDLGVEEVLEAEGRRVDEFALATLRGYVHLLGGRLEVVVPQLDGTERRIAL